MKQDKKKLHTILQHQIKINFCDDIPFSKKLGVFPMKFAVIVENFRNINKNLPKHGNT